MSKKQILLWSVLFDFTALCVYLLYTQGLGWVADLGTLAGVATVVDLTIALTIICTWMVSDARERGMNPWGYVALTVGTGSIGPLLYLVLRQRQIDGAALAVRGPVLEHARA